MALVPNIGSHGNLAVCARVGRSCIVRHSVEVTSALSRSSQSKWIKGQAVFPIFFGLQHIGIMDCESTQESFFTSDRIEELEASAAQLGALWAWDSADEEKRVLLDKKVAELKQMALQFEWCGVYRLEKGDLHLSSFRGVPSPHSIISKEEGICGAAVRENKTLNIEDVKLDARYLACDPRTRSELVVPIRDSQGNPVGGSISIPTLQTPSGPRKSPRSKKWLGRWPL